MENAEPIANSRKRWLPFALLIAGYALIDFVVTAGAGAYLIKSDFPSLVGLSVILGCFLAQLGALAAWGALGTCRAIIGWVTTLFVSEILLALLVVADIYFFGSRPFCETGAAAICDFG